MVATDDNTSHLLTRLSWLCGNLQQNVIICGKLHKYSQYVEKYWSHTFNNGWLPQIIQPKYNKKTSTILWFNLLGFTTPGIIGFKLPVESQTGIMNFN